MNYSNVSGAHLHEPLLHFGKDEILKCARCNNSAEKRYSNFTRILATYHHMESDETNHQLLKRTTREHSPLGGSIIVQLWPIL